MTIDDLKARADAVRAHARVHESVAGSGLHDNDRNPTRPDLFAAPQRNGLPRQSEHVVAFFDAFDEWVHFAGVDVRRVCDALVSWKKKADRVDPFVLSGTERKLALRIVPTLAANAENPLGTYRVRRDHWNDILYALQFEGVGVSCLPLEE